MKAGHCSVAGKALFSAAGKTFMTNLRSFRRTVLFLWFTTSVLHAAEKGHSASDRPPKPADQGGTFSIGPSGFLLNGHPFVIRCGEMHYARVPREYWRHRLQMIRAMGLNAVCAYLFWNFHELEPGKYDWSGDRDVVEFCRMAQQEGLWVILRPGPYACAEWEAGGLPWWLYKNDSIAIRSRDPKFMEPARRWLCEVGRLLAPLQVTRGGPILMVQVENEYGFFGNDASYMGEIRDALKAAGFGVPLFACSPAGPIRNGWRDDLFYAVNFGRDPGGAFDKLRRLQPSGPLMNAEYYPGWFDTWGSPHHLGKTDSYLADLTWMVTNNASFSIYMAHGGTSFGFWQGSDRPFKPDTTSYDYDAPISEAGWVTEKFRRTRELLGAHLQPGERLPPVPASNSVISFEKIRPCSAVSLLKELPLPVRSANPLSFEKLDQPFGAVLYRCQLPAGPAAELKVGAANDIGYVFLGGQSAGYFDRRHRSFSLRLPPRSEPQRLDVLVEAMGRVNFGQEAVDRKGLFAPVTLDGVDLGPWEIFRLPLDHSHLGRLSFGKQTTPGIAGPVFYRFEVPISSPGDTFLDMSSWGKGVAWVNGHCLGRFWQIGPTRTLYVPGPWLKPGTNEFVVLDYLQPRDPVIAGLEKPILNECHPERDVTAPKPSGKLFFVEGSPVVSGRFPQGADPRTILFKEPVKGRYFAIESLSSQDGSRSTSIADLSLLDGKGNPLPQQNWSIASVISEETTLESAPAVQAIDGQISNYWITARKDPPSEFPHFLVLDLGREEKIGGFTYVPRQGGDKDAVGRIKDYRVFVGKALVEVKRPGREQ